MVTRWQVQGKEVLYLDAERFANPHQTVRGGIPILFPICGGLHQNCYQYQGQQYTLKQHGIARDLPWTVVQKQTTERAAITLQLTSNAQTLAFYPFEFKLEFTYTLKGNHLEILQRCTHLAGVDTTPETRMPFAMGLHPYFLAPDKEQLHFEIPALQYFEQQRGDRHDFTGSFDSKLEEIDVIFPYPLTGLATIATDRSRNLRIVMSYSCHYANLVFWMVKGKEYYCLEPWTAPRNALNTGKLLTYLKPGESCEMAVNLIAMTL